MKFVQILFSLLVISGISALNNEWWKHANIYEIYLRSFKDSDGDGIGDIKGLISKLDYLVDIGVDTVYLTPFYPSSMADGGYDITDYKGIDSVYGTMEDFEQLVKRMNAKGLHLVIDLVINHSSDEHEWFLKSINKIAPYTDYYIWADPKGYDWNGKPVPPNNWFSMGSIHESRSAWTWNESRKQFYLHLLLIKQPDLNLRNENVKAEIKNIMKFWLEKGVSGFRVDAPMMFMEDEQLRDNPPVPPGANMFTVFSYCEYTYNHPDTFRFIGELNVFLQQFDRTSRGKIKLFIGETYGSMETIIKYYGTKRYPLFNLPLNYFFIGLLGQYLDAHQLHNNLQTWLDKVPRNMQSTWALGNHDFGRVTHYFTSEYNSILLALVTTLPGAFVIYFGEELTMGANKLVPNKDPYLRDIHRSPMHWDGTRNSGFTSSENPWLPVHPNYWHYNVQTQKTFENSSLNYFKDLTSLRKTDTVKYGNLKFHIVSKWVMAYSRTYKGTSYIVVMNLGTETQPIDLYDVTNNISTTLTVVACSPNSGYKKGYEMKTTPNYPTTSLLRPHSVVVLSSR